MTRSATPGGLIYYCDHHEIPLPPGHRFPARKYALLREILEAVGSLDLRPAPMAQKESIELIHSAHYVQAFLDGKLPAAMMRRIGFPWSEGLVRRTLASVGGTIAAAHTAINSGWSGTLAGGTHHAFRDEGSGFCVFNDIAVAIAGLRSEGRIQSAAVVDLDVHQGDGTAKLFENDPAVLTLSIHGRNNFPFRKQRSKIDVDLSDGSGDSEFLIELEAVLPRVFEFQPDIVFYQSGVDALASDRLGRLSLTHAGLHQRDCLVFTGCVRARIPCVVTLGGGYSNPIEATVEAHANTFLSAAKHWNEYRARCERSN